jgi:nucleoside-diphosphate-sugar epimerase
MKVLLTGASGFLGKYIFDSLSKKVDLYTLSRFNSNFNFDISKKFDLNLQCFDLVIHNAGIAHFHPKNKDDENKFFDINVTGTTNLINALNKTKKPDFFVFISSVAVYGLNSGINIDENSKLLASDPYGKSKILAEEIVQKWCLKYNIKCVILRLPLVAGKMPPGNLKSMISGIKSGYYFNVLNGKARKSIVLAENVADIILTSLKMPGIYNLTDGYHPSFYELSNLIASQIGRKSIPNLNLRIAKLLAKFGDLFGSFAPINSIKLIKITSDLTFDDSKARSAFNWKPDYVLDKCIFIDN